MRLAWFDGERCALLDPPDDYPPDVYPQALGLSADPRGEVVVAYLVEQPSGEPSPRDWRRSLVRLDAGRWTLIDGPKAVPFVDEALAVAPNGDIWRSVDVPGTGLERHDGERWITVLDDVTVWRGISIAPDGAVWYLGPYGVQRVAAEATP